MSKKKIKLLLCVLFLCTLNVSGQEIQKSILYKTSTSKTFKVNCGVIIDSLSPLDWVYLETKPALIRHSEFVIANYWLTITYRYPQMPRYERDYEFLMGKSVTDAWGTRLYYHNGEEYFSIPNDSLNAEYQIVAADIDAYGFFNGLFDVSLEEITEQLDSMSILYARYGQKLLIIYEDAADNERMEMETDYEQLYFEIRKFEYNTHIFTHRTEYKRIDEDWIIPNKEIHIHYSELPSGTPYQITEIETYLSYQIVNDAGDTIVNISENISADFTIVVNPNPAQDSIWVHFSIPITKTINVLITDMMGNVVLEQEFDNITGNTLFMYISQLEPGIYTVICTYENNEAQTNFVKEGIGQYPYPSIINFTVIPNPATDVITLQFNTNINDIVHIVITDVMGVTHWGNNSYVADNILSINVQSLTDGMYSVVCQYGNNGVSVSNFFKQ